MICLAAMALVFHSSPVIASDPADSAPSRGRIAPIEAPGPVPVSSRPDVFREEERKVVGFLLAKYGTTDWSVPLAVVLADPGADVNPNIAMIPLSLAQALLFRFRAAADPADLASALDWGEWVAGHHAAWGDRWLSPLVVCYLELTARGLTAAAAGTELEARAAGVLAQARAIDAEEADARLSDAYPYLPLDSSTSGDTKAEEDAWVAALLAAAANSLPSAERAAAWEAKARELAYDAITVAADPPYAFGPKTTTVKDDFSLPNHGFVPNEYYTAATINLLETGALFYFLRGAPVPDEFAHHVEDLFAAYRAHVDPELRWTAPCDEGDATLFPLAIDSGAFLERRVVAAKARAGYLWRAGGPVPHVGTGEALFEAIEDAKTLEQYLTGSYFWHWSE
jgi:hypothetical protein